ncbi:MAG: histidine phosphatase family protein [Rhodospirillales bacterium]
MTPRQAVDNPHHVHLMRHGESLGNANRVFSGVTDHPLTELGRRQAAEAGQKFAGAHFAAVLTSHLSRSIETADIVLAAAGCRADRRDRSALLDERDFGVLENTLEHGDIPEPMTAAVNAARHDALYRPDGGESLADTYARAEAAWHDVILPAAGDGDILVVSHGNVIKCLIARFLGWPLDLIADIPMRNCLCTRLPATTETPRR